MNKLTWMTATAAVALLGTASAWADGKPTCRNHRLSSATGWEASST